MNYRPKAYALIKPTLTNIGIPVLLSEMEASGLPEPFRIYQNTKNNIDNRGGTFGFYTDDYRFEALWENPDPLIASGIKVMIEPNFTITPDDDPPVALFQLYRKRRLAFHAQTHGIEVYVDLHLPRVWIDFAFEGLPLKWSHFATRGLSTGLDDLQLQYDLACEHAEQTLTRDQFVVYGGGANCKEWALEQGVIYLPDMIKRCQIRGQRKVQKTLPDGRIFEAWEAIPEEAA